MSRFGIVAMFITFFFIHTNDAGAQTRTSPPPALTADSLKDGQRDFDFELGTWRTQLRRRLRPLTGSTEWVEYQGTTTVRPVWNGRANLVELDVTGPAGHIEGLSLRLYNPDSHQWTLNFSNSASGVMAIPTVGGLKSGQGHFYNEEKLGPRAILVRFVITPSHRDRVRFEQAYSADGGKNWEVNWIAVDTRVGSAVKPTR